MRSPDPSRRLALTLALGALALGACGNEAGKPDPTSSPPVPEEQLTGVEAFPNPEQLVRTIESIPLSPPDGATPGAPPAEVGPPAALSLTSVGPDARPSGFQIGFNQAMKTFAGSVPLTPDGPLTVSPAVAGTLRWVNDATLAFRPDHAFPVATRFEVEVKPGLVAADGRATSAPFSGAFETERLAVTWAPYGSLDYPAGREPGDAVDIELNFPVLLADVEQLLEVTVAESAAAFTRGVAAPAPFEVSALPAAEDGTARTGFAVRPRGGFLVGSIYRLRIPTTLHGIGPLGLAATHDVFARGPERLEVNYANCGSGTCTAESEWTIGFNNPVVAATIPGCIALTPAVALDDVKVDGNYVSLRPSGLTVGQKVTLRVGPACRDNYGTRMASATSYEFQVAEAPARIRMTEGSGYLEPPSAGEGVAIAMGVSQTGPLTVRRLRIPMDALGPFLAEAVDEYSELDLSQVAGGATQNLVPKASDSGLTELPLAIDDLLGADQRGVVFVEVQATREDGYGNVPVRRALVQVTDTGLTIKTSPQNTLVWTTSLATAAPIAGAEVRLLDEHGATVWQGKSDAAGLAVAPGTASLSAKPRVVVASSGGDDLAFVDLGDWSTRIEPYRFNLPYAWDPEGDVVRGFVFSERGVYRSGEKVYLKGYMRADRGRKLELLPTPQVTVEVLDPLGEVAKSEPVTLGPLGDFDLSFELPTDATLGSWSVRATPLEAAGLTGDGQGGFRVEAYRPNRFEVKVADARRDGDTVRARVNGRYLYGAPMVGTKVTWYATRSGDTFAPAGFGDFSFAAASDTWWWEPDERSSSVLASGTGELDADGGFDVSAALGELDFSNGPLQVNLEAEVTDVDEQVVAGRGRLRLDPAAFYVGVQREGALVEANKAFTASAVAVDPAGKQLGDVKVELTLKKRTWESVKKAAAGGGTTWVSEKRDELVAMSPVTTLARGPVQVSFTAPTAGLYVVEAAAIDPDGRRVMSSEQVWVWGGGEAWWARSDDERLTVVAEKDHYAVGDVARFLVQSPFPNAQALITVERQGVIWQKAVAIEGGAPMIEVPVTEEMQPNAFVSFVLVRGRVEAAASDPDAGRPAAKIGYATLKVDLGDKILTVGVAPERASYRPGETVKTTLSLADAAGAPVAGRITFFAVDEGVLQLTGYSTPNPLASFFADRPLAVSTVESRRRLWTRLTPTDDGMKSDWGGSGDEGATNYRSAFATTAVFLPSVEVGPDGRAEVAFALPDNLGAFRLMAVAAAEGNRFGRADTRIEVNKPVLVRPGLPRFLSSGDVFEARVIVQALQDAGAGEVQVALSTSGPVEVLEASTVTTTLTRGKAEAITFKARALAPGAATFAFKVTPAGQTQAVDAVKIELPVQFPATVRAAITAGKVGADHGVAGLAARRVETPDWIRDDVGGLEVEVTASALGELLPGLRYLIEYPYGCVEQTTGGTLPLLALANMSDTFSLPGVDHAQVIARAQAGVDRLRTMQVSGGGLSYWPGGTEPHPWGSVYGGLALVRAHQTAGLNVPNQVVLDLRAFLKSLLAGQVKVSNEEWGRELHPVEPFAAYVLALAGDADAGSSARLYEQRATLPAFSRALLAMAVAEAKGDPGMIDTLMTELLAELRVDGDRAVLVRKTPDYYYATMDSDVRTTALVLMALMRTRPADPMVDKLARGLLAERRGGRWTSTQDNGFAILALGDYFHANEKPGQSYLATVRLDGAILLSERMESATMAPRRVTIPMAALRAAKGKLLTITREGDDAPLFYTLRFDYTPAEVPKIPIQRGFQLDREYVYADGERAGERVTTLAPGDLVRVRLHVTAPDNRRYVAIDDPFPAGLEPVNTGFDTTGQREGGDAEETSWVFSHAEQRDDRVTLFADWMPRGSWSHTYLARATTAGAFLAPAARVHEMYQPDVFGQAAAVELTVQ